MTKAVATDTDLYSTKENYPIIFTTYYYVLSASQPFPFTFDPSLPCEYLKKWSVESSCNATFKLMMLNLLLNNMKTKNGREYRFSLPVTGSKRWAEHDKLQLSKWQSFWKLWTKKRWIMARGWSAVENKLGLNLGREETHIKPCVRGAYKRK